MRRSENEYQAKWKSFRQLTGIDTLQETPAMPKEIPVVQAKVGEVLDKLADTPPGDYRPTELANAEDRVRSEQLNYEIQKVRLRPQFGVSISASQDDRSPDGNSSSPRQSIKTYAAVATANWNVFDGFATQAAKQSSQIRLRQLKSSRDQAERDYRDGLKNQVETLRVNWQALQRTEKSLEDARSIATIVKSDFEVGAAPKQSWESAQRSAESALQAANSARADYYLQIANYLSMRGKDSAVTLPLKK
jgi:outer membrane protein TolC